MQTSVQQPQLNKSNGTATRRRRRRPRNRRKQKQQREDEKQLNDSKQVKAAKEEPKLDLTDLSSEAHALEKQLAELQTQLKINYSSIPSKEQGRIAGAIAAEQISATEEEIAYVRSSLKKTYRQIFDADLIYATTYHIEDKIWRYIFYAEIEEVRSKLRKVKPSESEGESKALQKTLFHRIDSAIKFYRELNNHVKSQFHIDTKSLGIDLFKQNNPDDKVGILLQFNYICMGDLARYHAQQAMAAKSVKKTSEYWSLAKSCYLKAIDVYRRNGKPYSQLALISISNGNAMDVVWYYCMSLAVKNPSSVGRDNLKSFYSKIRFSLSSKSNSKSVTDLISLFVESFLHMHRAVMFSQKDAEEFAAMMPIASQLGAALSLLIASEEKQETTISKSTRSMLHIMRTTLTRCITILMISIWIAGERLKDKANYNNRSTILSSQIHMYTFAFYLLTGVYRSARQAFEQTKDSFDPAKFESFESLVDEALLPGLSIWSSYLYTNLTPIAQYCMTASNDTRNREPEKKILVKSIQSLLSLIIGHPSFPDPVLNVLPPTYPLSEDLSLLGVVPLIQFHNKVDFFKEMSYDVVDENGAEARKQVRWGRTRGLIKKIADSSSFDFIQYNQTEQKYSVIDENAKRQQQSRFMKALATQRLMEQVSSLEKNVNRMTLQGKRGNMDKDTAAPIKCDVYTCVVDVTAFLDGLNKVKKWANQTLNVDRRSQGSILEVIVPLEVIDSLDYHKKGTSHMNMQARESIRFLDQKLSESNSIKTDAPTSSFLRTQKVTEKLADWSDAKDYWIGEESRSNLANDLLSEDEEDETAITNSESEDESEGGSSDDEDLFKSRRRRGGDSDDETDSSVDEEDEESEIETEEAESDDDAEAVEEYTYEEDEDEDEDEDDEAPYTLNDVPKSYRPIISCLLYYHSIQKAREDKQPERLVLVTNDDDLAWWAELFGDPKTGKRLLIKTVNEWDQMVSKLDFEKVYEYSWKHR